MDGGKLLCTAGSGGFALTVFPALPFSFFFIFYYYFSRILLRLRSVISGTQDHQMVVPVRILMPSALRLSEVIIQQLPCVWTSLIF